MDVCRLEKNFDCTFPAKVGQDDMSCFSSHTAEQAFFPNLFSATFFAFLCKSAFFFFIFVGDLLFKVALKHSAKMLSSVPQGKEGCDVPYREKMCVR